MQTKTAMIAEHAKRHGLPVRYTSERLIVDAFDRSLTASLWGGVDAAHRALRRMEREYGLRPGQLTPVLDVRTPEGIDALIATARSLH
jgi:isochorismate hydrolase